MSHLKRVIVLVDMDCFYCQVEEKLDPNLEGKPIAVVQYNAWKGGGIIAVNYPARDRGVTRHMRGDEAKGHCPEIELVKVPNVRGKADLTKYREAGKAVAAVLQSFTALLERASVDEAYLDITEAVEKRLVEYRDKLTVNNFKNTYVVGSDLEDFLENLYTSFDQENNLKLAVGALITEEIREAVFRETGYKCSAGIGHNKIMAKLVCGLNKPNKQTIVPHDAIPEYFSTLPVRKIKSLGGKFGVIVAETLNIQHMGELSRFSERELIQKFEEKNGSWLYNIARGIDTEPVAIKLISKSIGCCKKFPGRNALTNSKNIQHWLNELSLEISERLEKDLEENNRRAKQMIVSFAQVQDSTGSKEISSSRTTALSSYEHAKIASAAFEVVRKNCIKNDKCHVTFLGISISKFEEIVNIKNITSFFQNMPLNQTKTLEKENVPALNKVDKRKNIQAYFQSMQKISEAQKNATLISIESENYDNEKEDIDNHSIFSANTVSLDENCNDLVFYEPNGVSPTQAAQPTQKKLKTPKTSAKSQAKISRFDLPKTPPATLGTANKTPNIAYKNETTPNKTPPLNDTSNIKNDSDNDSIGNEMIFASNSPVIPIKRSESGSFFMRYFEHLQGPTDEAEVPCKRDFDTSKILDDENSNSPGRDQMQIDEQNAPTLEEHEKSTPEIQVIKEKCAECGKNIFITEMVSHMDYHFALKLMEEERSSHKMVRIPPKDPVNNHETKNKKEPSAKKSTSSNAPKKAAVKRKLVTKDAILPFLKKPEENSQTLENTEICAQCSKRIKLIDFESHMDFHAAKKLHLELNVPNVRSISKTSEAATVTKVKKGNVKNSVKNNKNGIRANTGNSLGSLAAFFKPAS